MYLSPNIPTRFNVDAQLVLRTKKKKEGEMTNLRHNPLCGSYALGSLATSILPNRTDLGPATFSPDKATSPTGYLAGPFDDLRVLCSHTNYIFMMRMAKHIVLRGAISVPTTHLCSICSYSTHAAFPLPRPAYYVYSLFWNHTDWDREDLPRRVYRKHARGYPLFQWAKTMVCSWTFGWFIAGTERRTLDI